MTLFPTFIEVALRFLDLFECYFCSLRTHPHWLVPLIVSSVGTIVLAYFSRPFTVRAVMRDIGKGIQGGAEDKSLRLAIAKVHKGSLFIRLLPLVLRTMLGAAILSVIAKLIVGSGFPIQMLALTSHLSVLSLLRPLHVLTVLRVRGIDGIRSRNDLHVPVGMSFLFPGTTARLSSVLDSVNIYEVAILWTAVVGVRALCECSHSAAVLVVSIYWVLGQLFTISAILFGKTCSILWFRFFLHHLGMWNRMSARVLGFKYLGPIGIASPLDCKGCGPATMQFILRQDGVDVPFEMLQREMMDRPQGTSMRRMKEVAERHGFRTTARRVSLGEVPRIPLPSIALFRRRHYVVVQTFTPDGSLIIVDPSIGRCRVPAAQFLKDCNGEMLLIQK